MRITFVAPHASLSGGIRVIAMHALGLQNRGHTVKIVSQPLPGLSMRSRVRLVLRGQFRLKPEPPHPSHFDGLPLDHRVLDRARPVTDADVPDADVVIATWWETAEWVAKLSGTKGAKVYLLQGDEACFYADPAARERVAATWRLPLRKVAVARWLGDFGRERCPGHEIGIVPNGVDLERFSARNRRKQSAPTVGLVSSPFSGKGMEVMLGAYHQVRRKRPDLRLVAFGEPPAPSTVAWPEEFPLSVRPPQDKIPGMYGSCDAWLFGSRREGFGLPILEAMACGTPVIATPAGAAPELLAPGGGILVNPEDPADMAAAILRVIAMSDDTWGEMSRLARRTAEGYTWEQSTDVLEAGLLSAAAAEAT